MAAEFSSHPEPSSATPRVPSTAEALPSTLAQNEMLSPTLTHLGPSRSATSAPSLALPGYELLGEIGRGGMGVVYKAVHVALKRQVALKMILDGPHASPDSRSRFLQEAQAVARLQHPNIVQIHDIGELNGLPYFSLELVAGGSLATKINGTPQPAAESAQLLETLARAVHHAHQRGIIHRDLKPANVLLTADGLPKITDFGLAKDLDASDGRTASGAILGTPCYMAPEQAEGRVRDIGPATDVYALGAILYTLLTGRPPFKGENTLQTLEDVRRRDPAPPREFVKDLPPPLETICLKCLCKDPCARYTSAKALADDLARFRRAEAIVAPPPDRMEPPGRQRRRPRRVAPLAWTAVLLVVVAGGWAFTLFRRGPAGTPLEQRQSGPAPARPRVFLNALDQLSALAADLRKTPVADRPRRRYLTLTHLHNDRRLPKTDLDIIRNNLSHLSDYLSASGRQVRFDPIDQEQTAFAFDLGELQGDLEETWRRYLKSYPYGLSHATSANGQLRETEKEVQDLSGSKLAFVRADWFLAKVTSPLPDGFGHRPETPALLRAFGQGYPQQTVDLQAAAAELFLSEPGRLEALLRDEPRLRQKFGLEPFLQQGILRRPDWESLKYATSPFQEVSRELNLGTPLHVQ